jgi:hypothetical protein
LEPDLALEALSAGDQYLVSRIVPVGVVEQVEPIQIDVQNTDIADEGPTRTPGEHARESDKERGAVDQARERLMSGLMSQFLLGHFATSDVDMGHDHTTRYPEEGRDAKKKPPIEGG